MYITFLFNSILNIKEMAVKNYKIIQILNPLFSCDVTNFRKTHCSHFNTNQLLSVESNSRYVKLFLRSFKLLRHYFCVLNTKPHKKDKLPDIPISLFVNRSHSFMDQ